MAPTTTFKIDKVLARHEWVRTRLWHSVSQARDGLAQITRGSLGFDFKWHLNAYGRRGRREWLNEVVVIELWEPSPQWAEPGSTISRMIMICRAANGAPVRIFSSGRRHAASADDCEGMMRYNGPEGPAIRAEAKRKSDEYAAEAKERRDRLQALMDDARFLLDEAGFEDIEIRKGLSKSDQVVLDLEDFLALCRAAHQARGFVLDA